MSRINSVLLPIGVTWLAHFIVDFMLGIWPMYKTLAGVDLALAGLMVGGAAFVGEGMQLLSGPLTDRGYGKVMLAAGAILACGVTLLPYTDSMIIWACLILATGIGSGLVHPAAGGILGGLPVARKNLLMGIFAAGGAIGLALSQLVFWNVYYGTNGQTLWLVLPSVLLLAIAAYWAPQKVAKKKAHPRLRWSDVRSLFADRSFLCLYGTLLTTQCVAWGLIFLMPDILRYRGYPDWLCFGSGLMAYTAGGAVLSIVLGLAADRLGEKPVMLAIMALAIGSVSLFVTYETMPIPLLLTTLFVIGGCFLAINPIGLSYGNRLAPGRPGLVSACMMGLVWMVAESVAPVTSGLLAKFFSDNAAARAIGMMTPLLVIGMGLLVRVRVPATEPAAREVLVEA